MDVDGSLTDGKIYMGNNGEIMKAFSVKDGYVFNYILRPFHIRPIVLTARQSNIVQTRCKELGIEDIYQGKTNKYEMLCSIISKESLKDCAYFGDDILDIRCMMAIKEAGGVVGCPSDAVKAVKAIAHYICANKAGEGALREFSEWIVSFKEENRIKEDVTIAKNYLKSIDFNIGDEGDKKKVIDNFLYKIERLENKNKNEVKLESHKNYVEIHMILEGSQNIEMADICRLTINKQYDQEKDIAYWNSSDRMTEILLKAGDYIILYPENAYRFFKCDVGSEYVTKVVGKIKIC